MQAVTFSVVRLTHEPHCKPAIIALLNACDLTLDPRLDLMVIGREGEQLVACAGLDHNVIKCVAVSPRYQGEMLSLKLMDFTVTHAAEQGITHLFLYTKPANRAQFKGSGFYPLVQVENQIVLMENTPVGLRRYCQQLTSYRREGRCGAIVMNANPFTLGHRYLVEQAAKALDWLYLFVVSEEASLFSAATRLSLVELGVKDLANVTVLPSTDYMISKATFPDYFLKDTTLVDQMYMAIDLLLFRCYIAPALTIRHRYVGSEPHSVVTAAYNRAMQTWLMADDVCQKPPIQVVQIPRIDYAGAAISASRVRSLLSAGQFQAASQLLPDSTWAYVKHYYQLNHL